MRFKIGTQQVTKREWTRKAWEATQRANLERRIAEAKAKAAAREERRVLPG